MYVCISIYIHVRIYMYMPISVCVCVCVCVFAPVCICVCVRRCPWCNGCCRRKRTRRHEFKPWTRLIAFHIAPLGKV